MPTPSSPATLTAEDLACIGNTRRSDFGLLIVMTGSEAGTRFELTEPTTRLGRDPTSDILLDDVTVSRHHAEILRVGPAHIAADCGSFNGTYLNGERIDEIMLMDLDELLVGRFTITFFTPRRRGRA